MLKDEIVSSIEEAADTGSADLAVPPREGFGHYATSVALKLAKERKEDPMAIAESIAKKLRSNTTGLFQNIETVPPGFVNIWVTEAKLQKEFEGIATTPDFGKAAALNGKTVMVEYTDPNPFKLFHIGHLMSNAIGEAIARLHEAAGAKVLRVNWQGDIGLHVAMAVWAIRGGKAGPLPAQGTHKELVQYLGAAYAAGANAYRSGDEGLKHEVESVNRAIYAKRDTEINALYDKGRAWSLEYFEAIYARLGTKFDHYFFESEEGPRGAAIVREHSEMFEESEGAIVFRGEPYGLHTRVFINSQGLPTYEAKELGLNRRKFDLFHPDASLIVTGNEIAEYFKVLLKVMERVMPEVAKATRHIPHGMLRLPSGKMSSRTGEVITADELIEQTKLKLRERVKNDESEAADDALLDQIAIGAIKYSILKQRPGQDIVFDFEKSLAVQGDSGPYLQYTHARLKRVLKKADGNGDADFSSLTQKAELALIRELVEFPDALGDAVRELAPSRLAGYLFSLANAANRFYEAEPILKDEHAGRRRARLMLVRKTAEALRRGINLLGIEAPERV